MATRTITHFSPPQRYGAPLTRNIRNVCATTTRVRTENINKSTSVSQIIEVTFQNSEKKLIFYFHERCWTLVHNKKSTLLYGVVVMSDVLST